MNLAESQSLLKLCGRKADTKLEGEESKEYNENVLFSSFQLPVFFCYTYALVELVCK